MSLTAIGWFLLGLVLLALGGDSIVKGASGLARRFGWSPFAAGIVLVALATSVPEIAVNAYAVLDGQPYLALGNAVGSNVANVGMTLAISVLVAGPLLVRWRALAPLLLALLGATLLVLVFSIGGGINVIEGIVLVAAFILVLWWAVLRAATEDATVREEVEAFTRTSDVLGLNMLRVVIAVALLGTGAWLVVENALPIGEALGMTSVVIGLLPVAIGTALPELAAAIVAARRGQGDLVAGHVIGSSLVNILLVLGGMALLSGGLVVPESFLRFELPAALVFAVMLAPMLRGDMRISRGEAAALLLAFVAWVVFELVLLNG